MNESGESTPQPESISTESPSTTQRWLGLIPGDVGAVCSISFLFRVVEQPHSRAHHLHRSQDLHSALAAGLHDSVLEAGQIGQGWMETT